MFAISHLAEQAGQRVFADFGTFMLERTVKSWADPDRSAFRKTGSRYDEAFCGTERELTPRIVKVFARVDERRSGKIAKLANLEARLGFDRPFAFSKVC